MLDNSKQWVLKLKSSMNAFSKSCPNIYLFSTAIPTEGIPNFIQEVRKLSTATEIHFHFILDKRTDLSPNDNFSHNLFKSNLISTVYKDGNVCAPIRVPLDFKEKTKNDLNIRPNSIKDLTLHYISVNLRDDTLLPPGEIVNEPGNIDYVGVTSDGRAVTGLARFDPDTNEIIPDDVLCWDVPNGWSYEDAVTIPHAYACVSMLMGKVNKQRRVLVIFVVKYY